MKQFSHLEIASLSEFSLILLIVGSIFFVACDRKQGDPTKFKDLSFDQLNEKDAPEGVVYRNGEIRLAEGYDISYSSDSTKAMIIRPGSGNGGTTAMRCECDGLVKLGCIVSRDEIITCKSLLCASTCKPILQIYEGFITKARFRETK